MGKYTLFFIFLCVYSFLGRRHRVGATQGCDRQTTSFNDFSIEAGILLRGNGAPRAMPDRHMFKLLAYGHPDVVAFQFSSPTHTYSYSLLPLSYTHLHAVYLHPLPHLGPASLCSLALKDCLADRSMASVRTARFRSSSSSVALVVSSDSIGLRARHRSWIDAA